MPVCSACARYWAPRAARSGRCPDCGGAIATATLAASTADEQTEKLPWHLKLLAVAFCLYMGWRLVQGVDWVIRRL